MSNKRKEVAQRSEKVSEKRIAVPRSLGLAAKGITNSIEFASMMSALMTDLIEGAIAPGVGNATCNAGGKLLKVVELQCKYGIPVGNGAARVLQLTGPTLS